MNIRKTAKFLLHRYPTAENVLRLTAKKMRLVSKSAQSYLHDYHTAIRYLNWNRSPGRYWPLSSELIFQYHKLEKGLCLPAESRRFFGADAAQNTCRLLREWSLNRADTAAPVYRAAIETLRAWRDRCNETPPPSDHFVELFDEVDNILDAAPLDPTRQTPIPIHATESGAFDHLQKLMLNRRSTRNFDGHPVDFTLVERAVEIAQYSPSACNRQPWHLHFYDEPDAIQAMLALQNGNTGFAHSIPLLAVVTADMTSFFDASERIEPALDGGLFLMSYLLALQSLGLSSCCLNWCVPPDTDRRGHEIGHIPPTEQILCFLAIGRARTGAMVPLSARRPVADVIRRHQGLTLPSQA